MFFNSFEKIRALIEVVFPKRADAAIIENLQSTALTSNTLLTNGNIHYLHSFNDPVVRACIHELKFYRNSKALELLSHPLHTYFSRKASPAVVVPIPLAKKRMRTRGFNQTELLAETLKHLPQITIAKNILEKPSETKSQTSLNRADRLTNIQDAFVCSNKCHNQVLGKHIVILDDVTTTGATLQAAKAALLPHSPASVTCLALAH